MRFFSQTPLNPDRLPYEVRIRPVLKRERRRGASRGCPRSRYAGIWVQIVPAHGVRRATRTQIADRLRRRRPLHGDPGRDPAPRAASSPAAELDRRRRWSCSRRRWRDRLFGRLEPDRPATSASAAKAVAGHRHLPERRRTSSSRRARRTAASCRSRPRGQQLPLRRDQRPVHRGEAAGRATSVTEAQDAVTVALRRARGPPARHAEHLRPHHPGPDPDVVEQLHHACSSS